MNVKLLVISHLIYLLDIEKLKSYMRKSGVLNCSKSIDLAAIKTLYFDPNLSTTESKPLLFSDQGMLLTNKAFF